MLARIRLSTREVARGTVKPKYAQTQPDWIKALPLLHTACAGWPGWAGHRCGMGCPWKQLPWSLHNGCNEQGARQQQPEHGAALVADCACHGSERCGIPGQLQHNLGRRKRKCIYSAVYCVLLRCGDV